ncbi:GNAT family N-acetyltransferase [Streptomyces sp. NPDC005953]|uniref:GNAT family N-acetyltransferase n=1 Tax=Streptomyces sp. NPDC005953 TaxID=3156719 RepID=UPI003406409B
MRPDDWHLTHDVDDFLVRAEGFLRPRLALHTTLLTVADKLQTRGADAYGDEAPAFGRLERAGETIGTFHRLAGGRLFIAALSPEHAESLALRMKGLGHSLPGVTGDHNAVTAFAEAWQRLTGATPTLGIRLGLYRLGTLTPVDPFPQGRGRLLGEQDREQLMSWLRGFATDVQEDVTIDADSWASTRFADKRYTFWETPDGTPVSLAGSTSMVSHMVRVDPVYTPAHLRGRGYGGAVTVEVTRAALAAGATDVVLFTNAANPTSNALYQRLGYEPVTNISVYDFAYPTDPEGS